MSSLSRFALRCALGHFVSLGPSPAGCSRSTRSRQRLATTPGPQNSTVLSTLRLPSRPHSASNSGESSEDSTPSRSLDVVLVGARPGASSPPPPAAPVGSGESSRPPPGRPSRHRGRSGPDSRGCAGVAASVHIDATSAPTTRPCDLENLVLFRFQLPCLGLHSLQAPPSSRRPSSTSNRPSRRSAGSNTSRRHRPDREHRPIDLRRVVVEVDPVRGPPAQRLAASVHRARQRQLAAFRAGRHPRSLVSLSPPPYPRRLREPHPPPSSCRAATCSTSSGTPSSPSAPAAAQPSVVQDGHLSLRDP
jgi:hypothetical protein